MAVRVVLMIGSTTARGRPMISMVRSITAEPRAMLSLRSGMIVAVSSIYTSTLPLSLIGMSTTRGRACANGISALRKMGSGTWSYKGECNVEGSHLGQRRISFARSVTVSDIVHQLEEQRRPPNVS